MANPSYVLDAGSYDDLGYVSIRWTNATKGADWYSWRVKRRYPGGVWETLYEELVDQANYEYKDYTAPSNTVVEYDVVRVYLVVAVPTEEAATGRAIEAEGSHYWLVHPTDATKTFPLRQVTAESFSDEEDVVIHKVIGRGRKADRATLYGVTGSLTAQLRDIEEGLTARQQMTALRLLRNAQEYVYLRNPFGDVWKVTLTEAGFSRIAGVGLNEYVDVNISYSEVA